MHPCYLCTGYRVDQKGRKTASKDGCFYAGQLRTIKNLRDDNERWKRATRLMSTKSARSELMKFNSVEFQPLDIFSSMLDVPLMYISPPDPLHCIRYFYEKNHDSNLHCQKLQDIDI